ncbi:response regulator [Xanthomonas campestris]|uniref:Response regulator n=1 Tax=Xanthomonas campestris pv. papavericola TaxID=487881 RepID=A0AAJ2X778_XANCA|nr:response regulator [Xanthomonas campestris]MEA9787054.1 response regulator [Xanthomonas campestris pv. raphani]MEC3889809.1 response regulator [Xanthomonas campestris pv. papavericola]
MSLPGRSLVLLVEDDTAMREMATLILEEHGLEVMTAPDASYALQLVHSNPALRLIVTDVVMPGPISGYDMACKLREAGIRIPVILVSGWTKLPGEAPENTRFLLKPYTLAAFYECVDASLEQPILAL